MSQTAAEYKRQGRASKKNSPFKCIRLFYTETTWVDHTLWGSYYYLLRKNLHLKEIPFRFALVFTHYIQLFFFLFLLLCWGTLKRIEPICMMRLENRFDVDDTNKSLVAVPTTANWITVVQLFHVFPFRRPAAPVTKLFIPKTFACAQKTHLEIERTQRPGETSFAFPSTLLLRISVWKINKMPKKSHQSTRRRFYVF